MKLIYSVLILLVLINAVYSAAMREGSEDLLRFLNDAFKMNLAPDHIEPTKFTETALETEKILNTPGPTAECKAPDIAVNVAEFSNTTPKPNLVEITGIAEEKSTESSNSDSGLTERTSAEDSREVESYKRLQLKTKVTDTQKTLHEHYRDSAESISTDTTEMGTEEIEGTNQHPSKATVMTDVSSQEMDKPEEDVRHRSLKIIENYSAEITGARQELAIIKEIHPIIHSLAEQINFKDQTGQPQDKHQQETYKRAVDLDSPEVVDTPDSLNFDAGSEELGDGRGRVARQTVSDQSTIKTTLLSNNQTNRSVNEEKRSLIKHSVGNKTNFKYTTDLRNGSQATMDNRMINADQNPACAETSVQHPREENNSLDAPNVDQKIQTDTMSYQNQLRTLCPSKRVVRTSSFPKEQLDLDSPERVNSELLDNSSERLEEHVSVV